LIEKLRSFSQKLVTILHVLYLSSFFVYWTFYVVNRSEWGVIQTGFFTTELIVFMFKMHSYLATNKEYFYLAESPSLSKEEHNNKKLRYPNNVTLSNYFWYLIYPVLVYELEYPLKKTERNWGYLIEKIVTFFGLFAVLHVLSVEYIEPTLRKSAAVNVVWVIFELIVPFFFRHVIIFYMVFDVACNTLSELTGFADRRFYDDWWNSTNFDEYARKWNIPVHEWLLRHIYLESIQSYKVSQESATILTFVLSAVFHEYFMSMIFRLFRPYFFGLQLTQLPLIFFGRMLKGTRIGNIFFWWCMILGPPMLAVWYSREYFLMNSN